MKNTGVETNVVCPQCSRTVFVGTARKGRRVLLDPDIKVWSVVSLTWPAGKDSKQIVDIEPAPNLKREDHDPKSNVRHKDGPWLMASYAEHNCARWVS